MAVNEYSPTKIAYARRQTLLPRRDSIIDYTPSLHSETYGDETTESHYLDKDGFSPPPKWNKPALDINKLSKEKTLKTMKTRFSKIIEPDGEENPLLK